MGKWAASRRWKECPKGPLCLPGVSELPSLRSVAAAAIENSQRAQGLYSGVYGGVQGTCLDVALVFLSPGPG